MAVEITCDCDQMAYRRTTKDSAGKDVTGAEVPMKRGDVLKIEESQTVELIDKVGDLHVTMKNVGTTDVTWKYVGNTDSTLPPGGVVKIDRALKLGFSAGFSAPVSEPATEPVQAPVIPVDYLSTASVQKQVLQEQYSTVPPSTDLLSR